jgi:hypothetical protein
MGSSGAAVVAVGWDQFQFDQRYGVEEYYIYDPDEYTLKGWQRQGHRHRPSHR